MSTNEPEPVVDPNDASDTPAEEAPPSASKDKSAWRLGLLTAGAALLGALVGGLFTLLAASMQLSSQAEQSEVEFFRSEKRDAYVSFLTNAQIAHDASREFWEANVFSPSSGPVELMELQRKRDDALDQVQSDANVIALVGSPEIANLASEFVFFIYNERDSYIEYSDLDPVSGIRTLDDSQREAYHERGDQFILDQFNAIGTFKQAARDDLAGA